MKPTALLLWLAACTGAKPADTGSSAPPPGSAILTATPNTLDLGEITAVGTATTTLTNAGGVAITAFELTSAAEGLTLELADATLAAGGSTTLTGTWAPPASDELRDIAQVSYTGEDGVVGQLMLPISGDAIWPSASLEVDAAALADVAVGCDATALVTLSNDGEGELVIDGLALSVGLDLQLLGADGAALPAFPWTVAPGEQTELALVYTPSAVGTLSDTLVATTNDPLQASVSAAVTGAGVTEVETSITTTVEAPQPSTIFIAASDYAMIDYYDGKTKLIAALPTFFQTLQDAQSSYRFALSMHKTSEVVGDVDYIDESYSVDEAVALATDMLAWEGPYENNDYLLITFENALIEHEDWLFDDPESWADSKLSLIAINNDNEVSIGSVASFVATYQSYKEDTSDVVVHAIGGELHSSCGYALPSQMLIDAAEATGGSYLDWCEDDWSPHLETFAKAAIGDRTRFLLTGDVVASSVEVTIDGVLQTDGWTYDEAAQEVLFDDGSYPKVGSDVRVDYGMAAECASP